MHGFQVGGPGDALSPTLLMVDMARNFNFEGDLQVWRICEMGVDCKGL